MKNEIRELLKKILLEVTTPEILKEVEEQIRVDIPEGQSHGDYFSNIALQAFKRIQTNIPTAKVRNIPVRIDSPRNLAEYIKSRFEQESDQVRVEVAGPGFINFFVSREVLEENLSTILQKKEVFGISDTDSGKKVMIEFTDPNPFKEFHIGHLYSNTVGESIARLFESQSAEVRRACYQGDVGLHVAKAIWGMKKKISDLGLKIEELESKPLQQQAKFLGESYALGARAYEEDSTAQEEIKKLNKTIYEKSDEEVNKLYYLGRTWSLDYFESLYTRLGTRFDDFYFESQVGEIGFEIVKQHIGDIFVEDQGAVIFPGEKYGLHNRVFINSLGLPTYEAKELGLAPLKYKNFPYDVSIILTGNEINEYFRVLLKALSLIEPSLADKTVHMSHGMVKLPTGKMSSRTGDVITGEWLLEETKKKITEKYADMENDTSEKVAIAAIKYAFLKSSIGPDITFSFEESIDLQGNSGPYLQYTAVRCSSILRKAEMSNVKYQISNIITKDKVELKSEEEILLRNLLHFPEVVSEAAERYAPNLLANYLFILAQQFNLFYQKHSILGKEEQRGRESDGNEESKSQRGKGAENQGVRAFRLGLTAAVGQTIQNGLYFLGIPVPERM